MMPAFAFPVANLIGMPAPSLNLVFPLTAELVSLLPIGFVVGLAIALASARHSQRFSRKPRRTAPVGVSVESAA